MIPVTIFSGPHKIATQLWITRVVACGNHLELFIDESYIGRAHFGTFAAASGNHLVVGRSE